MSELRLALNACPGAMVAGIATGTASVATQHIEPNSASRAILVDLFSLPATIMTTAGARSRSAPADGSRRRMERQQQLGHSRHCWWLSCRNSKLRKQSTRAQQCKIGSRCNQHSNTVVHSNTASIASQRLPRLKSTTGGEGCHHEEEINLGWGQILDSYRCPGCKRNALLRTV